MNINVISGEFDGAQLKREKARNSYHVSCKGKNDSEQVQEAIASVHKSKLYSLPEGAWERIFG